MIPTEDNYTDWTLNGIRDYFSKTGYRMHTHSVGQRREVDWPFDRILAVGRKLFGLQFKRPRQESSPWRYRFRSAQHRLILQMPWILYCLPLFTDSTLQDVALFHCAFARPQIVDLHSGRIRGISMRWGALAVRILACVEGIIIADVFQLGEIARIMAEQPADVFFTIDHETRELNIVYVQRDRGAQR